MTDAINDLRQRLADLAVEGARAARSSEAIGTAAHSRIDLVSRRIEELRPTVLTDPAAAQAYQDLVMERGRLEMVIAQSPSEKS